MLKKDKQKKISKNSENNIVQGKTFIGTTSGRKPIYTPDDAKHIFICGTTGSGKTVALSNYIKSGVEKDYPMMIIDGKGDTGDGSIYDIVKRLKGNKRLYVVNMTNPLKSDFYNPFQGATATIAKDMLINLTDWSEEHYKLNTERYLQRLLQLLVLNEAPLSFRSIIKNMSIEKFSKLSGELSKKGIITKDEHLDNIAMSKGSGRIAESAFARFSLIAESELGYIFNETGIDIYTALKEKAIILFILNPLIFPELSPLIGRLILIDSKKALSNMFGNNNSRTFFIMDEINSYASPVLIDLVNKSRSANITCILATQSLSDLDYAVNEAFKEQIIENCNNYIVMRQNSSINAEHWANILGTRNAMEVTYQLQQKGLNTAETGFGSAKRVREYFYHPDDIKVLKTGQGILLSKDNHFHSRVIIYKPF
ncbi:MAG: type IV secretion system DNA-binding domain-containing protein [Oscillospiraceae bacterium]|nr:type IV secretion system DNA-binding domain-containing protein [Oscillospiraceae bacterium]